ncbi:putative DNA-binding WGR domain protein [Streptomyces sp. LBL]|uniref:DUF4132 domain-containing protein n=1 Tax=Streptomyces sp. LBL TaxID=2940562 RepID=UPI002475E4FC|nr:DUF4132 domain-containing protein [Streptomyces sp. LBL]MDH6624661.1 putative DNA-binding WGR domain protein [Streptomyces sp. LBL]
MRRWELADGGKDSPTMFWEVGSDGAVVIVRHGEAGAQERTRVEDCGSATAAEAYVAEAVREKERQGYAPVGAGHTPDAGGTGDVAAAPDEDSFTLPAAWRQSLRPRRGGITRYSHAPHESALDSWDRRLAAAREEEWTGTALGEAVAGIDPELAAAARRYLKGAADPVGAAVLAVVTDRRKLLYEYVVDAWTLRHGLAFAARATVELFGIHREDPVQDRTTGLAVLPEGKAKYQLWLRRGAADRVRTLLYMADENTYREAVAALAAHRGGARRRIVVSYLVPSETGWVAECCADPGESGREDRVVRAMLFESLNDEEQLRALLREGGVSAYDGSLSAAATVAEGVGPAVAALIAEIWRHRMPSRGVSAEELAGVLAQLPTDEAFELLMSHADDKQVHPALLEAARRYPVRAARLLADRAAPAPGRNAHLLGQLLTAHVAVHRELMEPRLAQFPPKAAEVVRELLHPAAADAPDDALPELLVSPPWTRERTAPEPRTVKGLVAGEETRMLWQPGEREAWDAAVEGPERRRRRQNEPYPVVEAVRQQFTNLDDYRLAALLTDGPDAYRPLLAQWTPEWMWVKKLKPVAARWEEDALPPLLHAATREPAVAGGLLLPYRQLAVARLMADWFVRLRSVAPTARAWFARHGADAAALLVPDAAGPAGAARHNAEHALRAVAATHGQDAVLDAAGGHGPEAVAVVRDLLSADSRELALPPKMPEPATWAAPRLLPRVLLRGRTSALPDEAVRHLLTMLAISRQGAVYTGVEVVKEACDPESLAEFGWSLFEQWRLAGMPARESWALHALGWLGDDDTVRRLTPVLRNWPGEGAHKRAVDGLHVLAAIGSDVALMHLHGVSQRVKFKGLKARAQEKIEQLAADLGLSGEELADRLVPDLGLDADGSTVVDYGPRRFTVGFDEQLRPYVLDQDGKRRKDLPKPGPRDDAELASAERKRFMALKKDVRTVASDQVRRLEGAMVAGRSWTTGEFRELFVSHPLLWHLVRRLVWLCVPAGASERALYGTPAISGAGALTAFRVAEDRTFADVRDAEFTLPEDASVRLAHPLHLGEELTEWEELFADHEILQPFPQLGRAVHRLTDDEAAGDRLERFENITVPTAKLLGLERRGWERDEPMFAGVQCRLSKRVAKDRWIIVSPSDGFRLGAVDVSTEQSLEFIGLSEQPSAWNPPGEPSRLAFAGLDPVTASELLADLTELVAR